MKLGCSTILYGGNSLAQALAGIDKAGYVAIELCAIPGMAPHIGADMTPEQIEGVRSQVADSGLAVESIGGSGNPLSADPNASFVRLLRIASRLGAPAITTATGGQSNDEESFVAVLKTVHSVTPIAADLNVRISVKPHVRNAVYSTATSLRFMQEVDADWVGINFDASHLWRTTPPEVPEEAAAKLAPYIKTVRIRDTLGHEIPIGPVENQIPGGGAMNLPALARELRKLESVPYAVLEIVGSKDFSLDRVQEVVQTCYDRFLPLFQES